VLTLGVTTCTITSLVFLPAVLAILGPRAADDEVEQDDEEDDTGDGADDRDDEGRDDEPVDHVAPDDRSDTAETVPFTKRGRRAA
jgi:hypothetical protein